MNKKILSLFMTITLAILAVLSSGCSGGNDDFNATTLSDDDFQYTLQTKRSVYEAKKLSEAAPFDVTLTIEYVGDQESIDVWCVDDLGTISMENEHGKALLANDFYTRATNRITLTKGKPYVIAWTGAEEFREYGGIPTGSYQVVAYINFSTDSSYESIRENTLNLSLNIK